MKAMKVEKAAAPAAKARKGAAAKKPARGAAGKPEPVGTRGKRTAIGARARVPAHHGDASSTTQGPTHLAGRSGQASKAGTRARAKKA